MKILKLEFENINSLKGEQLVDFTQEPLLNAEIFAIIGPTGSGKSTLLDVITLALFNKTPRFKSISKNNINNEGSIITRNQKSAYAQITYQVGATTYRSKWSIRYNRNGNLNDYHLELWENDKPLDLKKGEVPAMNEQIIGLNYDQFTKAIILSQGDFSKFLKADKNERSALLEKITGTSIYRALGAKAFQVAKEKKQALGTRQESIATIQLLTAEEIESYETELNTIETTIQQQTAQLKEVTENLLQKESYNNLQQDITIVQNDIVTNEQNIQGFAPKLLALQLHHKTVPHKKAISDYTTKQQEIAQEEEKKKEILNNKERELQRKQNTIQLLAKVTKQEVTEENFLEINNEFENKVKNIQTQKSQIITDGTRVKNELETLLNSSLLKEFNLIINNNLLANINDNKTTIEQFVTQQGFHLTTNVNDVQAKKTELEHQLQDYRELRRFQEQQAKFTASIQVHQKQINTCEENLKDIPLKLEQQHNKLELATTQLENLELKAKIASFEEHRNNLENGKPCPLCGSENHPFVHSFNDSANSLFNQISEKKEELQQLRNATTELEKQESQLKALLQSSNDALTSTTTQLNELERSTKERLLNIKLFNSVQDIDIELKIKTTQQQVDNHELVVQSLLKIEPLQQVKQKAQEREKIGEDYKKVDEQIKQLYQGKNISDEMNHLQNEFNESNSDSKIYQNEHKQIEELISTKQKELSNLEQDIEEAKRTTGLATILELKNTILTPEVVQQIEQTNTTLTTNKAALQAKLDTYQQKLAEFNTEQIERLELEHLQQTQQELDTKIAEQTKQSGVITERLEKNNSELERIEQLKKESESIEQDYQRWEQLSSLIGDSTGNKFATFAQSLTLKQLIVYTNQRLKKLSNRYLIFVDESTQELMIIDHLQGNTKRSVKTLSGGETFMVSLALALSLSDMASQNVRLESLFIDEGFGTLDEDSLESAMNLLEKLQSESDKTVGIISHVKQLKERIAVQIQLNKNSLGHSTIHIVNS